MNRISNMGVGRRRGAAGFTLVEVMAVIALIAVMLVGIGLAFRGSTGGQALASGQTTLASIFIAAQTQAATSGRDVFVMLDTNPGLVTDPNRGFLRRFVVLRRTIPMNVQLPTSGSLPSPIYQRIGREVFLPEAVHVVPPRSGQSSLQPAIDRVIPIDDPELDAVTQGLANRLDFFPGLNGVFPNEYANQNFWHGWRIMPNGCIEAAPNAPSGLINQIVLCSAVRLPPAAPGFSRLEFREPHNARGVRISYYGQVSSVDYMTAFD